jgi:hypothetical protein
VWLLSVLLDQVHSDWNQILLPSERDD